MGTCAILSEPALPACSPVQPVREAGGRRPGTPGEGSDILPFGRVSSRRLHHLPPMDLDNLTDEELIERARRAAPGASDPYLSTLYRRYQSKVAAWCLRICNDREEAADVAQEVFLRVHERIGSFRGDSRFSPSLHR